MREGWKYKRLGEIAYYPNLRVSVSDLSAEDYVGVENLIKDRGGVSFGTSKPNIESAIAFSNDDILIGNIRPYLRKIWLANKEGGASGDIVLIRIRNEWAEYISPAYLFKVLSSERFFEYDNANTKGAKMPRGDRKSILDFVVPVPPLPEQERIVAELDLLTGIIDKQKAQLKELDNLAQSIFYDMFGDPVQNEKGWIMKSLCEIGEIVTGSTPSTNDESNWDGDVNWVTPAELGVQLYYGETVRKITDKAAKSLTLMPVGTVLLSSRAPIGKLAITSVPMCCNQGFKNIVCGREMNNVFLYYFLMLTMESIKALGRGATFMEVSKRAISDYKTIVPPITLQESFAQKIQSIESQKAAINRSIAETQKLFDYTMDKYFG